MDTLIVFNDVQIVPHVDAVILILSPMIVLEDVAVILSSSSA